MFTDGSVAVYVTILLTEMRKLTACYLWFVGPVWDVKFSGAARVVTCGDDGTIRLWDSWSAHCVAVLSGHLDAVLSISLRQITGYCMKTLEKKKTKACIYACW